MDKRIWKPLAMTLAVSAASASYAYADVDIDNDGLIEISTLEQLDLMRYDAAGTSLNGDSTGCPAAGCNGYELVADLDFDSNGNGVADDGDLFWNGGEGWEPITLLDGSVFDGNNHKISNLQITRPGENIGLYASIVNSTVQNIHFENASIEALNDGFVDGVGTLSGHLTNSNVFNVSAHDISIFYENRVESIGLLVGYTYSNSSDVMEISNIDVSGSILPESLQWGDEVGGVLGYARSQNAKGIHLKDISSVSEVRGGDDIGGIVGYGLNLVIENVTAETICNVYHSDCGGVVGQGFFIEINSAAVTGVIGGAQISANAGGIVGSLESGLIQQSSFTGEIAMSSDRGGVGGIVGFGRGISIIDSVVHGSIEGLNRAGGLVGGLYMGEGYPDTLIASSYSTAAVSGSVAEGGLVGVGINYYAEITPEDISNTVISSYWDTDTSGVTTSIGGEGKSTFELQCPTMPGDVTCDASMYADWDETIWDFGTSSEYPLLIGDDDKDGVRNDLDMDDDNDGLIEISTLEQLDLMRYDAAGTSLNGDSTGCPAAGCNGYELVADLDFDSNGNGVADDGDLFWNGGEGWEPITLLDGSVFDGNNHKISNLQITRPGENIGLYASIVNSTVQNIHFENASIEALNDGFVDGVGTLSGHLTNSNVFNVSAHDISIFYENRVESIGLLVGYTYSNSSDVMEISNIDVSGSILPESLQWGDEVGGVLGYARSQNAKGIHLKDISSVSEVRGGDDIGGIVGYGLNLVIENVTAETICNVYHSDCGGVVGQGFFIEINSAAVTGVIGGAQISANAGGIVGSLESGLIQQSSFTGEIAMSSDRGGVGGIVGFGRGISIIDSVVHGSIEGLNRAGGLVGGLYMGEGYPDTLIASSYSTAAVSGSVAEGGLVGVGINYYAEITPEDISNTVISSYWDTDTSGVTTSIGGEGKSTFELQCPTMPGDVTCDASMYADWDETIWDFGTSSDYPVLR